jgi:hypothetical protein
MMSLMSRFPFVFVPAVAMALTGCATMRVGSSLVERGTPFAQYHTYKWAPAKAFETGDPRLDNNPFFQARVQADVEKQLAARGLERTTSGGAELTIYYHTNVTQQFDLSPQKYGYCSECKPYVYDAGTLVVDFVETRTARLVWRGWAEDSLEGAVDNQRSMEKKIDEAVTRILRRLPRS